MDVTSWASWVPGKVGERLTVMTTTPDFVYVAEVRYDRATGVVTPVDATAMGLGVHSGKRVPGLARLPDLVVAAMIQEVRKPYVLDHLEPYKCGPAR